MRSSSSRAFCFFLLLLCSLTLQYVLRHCKSAHPDRASSSVLQRCKSTRPDRAKFFGAPHRASSDLFFLCWFFLYSSSNRSRFGLLQNRVLETRFYSRSIWQYLPKSASRIWVFGTRYLDWNRPFETRDTSLQYSPMSTYYVLSLTNAILQIPS